MNTLCRRLLIVLFVCALPAMAAADTTPGGRESAAPAQPVPEAVPTATQKAVADLTPQPAQQSTTPAPASKSNPSPATQPAIRIGYVDLIRVSTDSEPGKVGHARLSEQKKKLQVQIDAKRNQLDKQRAAIEAKLSSLSPQQRGARIKEFGKKVEEFQKFGQNSESKLQELQEEQSRVLLGMIEQAAGDYGKANGLTAVIVKRDLLYAASDVDVRDVTDGVMKIVNEKGSKK